MGKTEKTIDFPAFLASMAHDMKNSLSMLLNTLDEVFLTCTDKNCPSHKQLSQVQYEATRVNYNLIQLLTLYKMDHQQFSINISQYPVIELLEDTILQNKPLLDFKGIEASIECDEDLSWFLDRNLISGVINNVLNNAYRYAKAKIKIRAAEKDGFLVLSIEDDGRGYPVEILGTGEQTKKDVSFKTGSTGLGLYFASIVAMMHKNKGREGFITLGNGGEYGGGCFTITLP
ncbi:MAG: HAMP domain-containing histidine kinase [Nitrospirae bacterium]|nr:HAMP domain-containing histidine kinase [Nitrospirota bacterium]